MQRAPSSVSRCSALPDRHTHSLMQTDSHSYTRVPPVQICRLILRVFRMLMWIWPPAVQYAMRELCRSPFSGMSSRLPRGRCRMLHDIFNQVNQQHLLQLSLPFLSGAFYSSHLNLITIFISFSLFHSLKALCAAFSGNPSPSISTSVHIHVSLADL